MNFPISRQYIYFDSAKSSGMYKELLAWRKEHDNMLLEKGSQLRLNHDSFIDSLRSGLGSFFYTNKNNVYLTQSFSIGLKSLLNILNPNLKLLLIKNDYPSILEQVKSNGFEYNFVENKENLENSILEGIKKDNPQVLILTLVQYINGLLINLDFLKKLKKLYPNLLIIADGTQFCGTRDFNFDNSGLDVLISSGYKWMFSGFGNGFLLIKKNIVKHFLNKNSTNMGELSFSLAFEPGNIDTLNFGSLLFSINKISNYGISKIEKRLKYLSIYAKKKFIDKNLLEPHLALRNDHSNIFNLKGGDLLYKELIKNKIICSRRGNGIRVSFNFYNKKKEIDFLLTFFNNA
jgi:selenocysteine lyase/cysteine desulfurase